MRRHPWPLRVVVAALLLGAVVAAARTASASGATLMLWPIDPVIEASSKGAAVWLENRGTAPLTLQVRVVGWTARNYTDDYVEAQRLVVASPPMATIAAGQRQLVRLMRVGPVPAGREAAFRVFIDEIPQAPSADAPAPDVAMGVAFRMRYSLPLFVYGPGAGRHKGEPDIKWRILEGDGRRWLEVRNDGPVHAKLTNVRLAAAGLPASTFSVTRGLLGYVLPGAEMRWPIPDAVPGDQFVSLETGNDQ